MKGETYRTDGHSKNKIVWGWWAICVGRRRVVDGRLCSDIPSGIFPDLRMKTGSLNSKDLAKN